jgi:ligand-binding sensor domain-containing protein
MRRPQWSKKWLLLAALPAVLALGAVAFVFTRAQHSLDRAGSAVAKQGRFPLDLLNLDLHSPGLQQNPGFEAIASPVTYASGAFYQGKFYVGGPSGLFVFGADIAKGGIGDALLKSYRVGLDLPAAPLGQIVVGRLRGASEPELIIATAGEGVLIFTGNGSADGAGSFRQIRPKNTPEDSNVGADARDVTALLPLPTGELLIGTRRRGLLVYRGLPYLETFHPQLAGLAVTALAADATGFWVGTRNQGLRHWHGGEIDSFEAAASSSERSGALPDNQIDAIAVNANKVFAGTPLGVEEFDDGRPSRVLAQNLFAHALFANAKALTIGTMDDGNQGIRRISLEVARRPGVISSDFNSSEDDSAGPAQQFLSAGSDAHEGELFAVLRDGLRREQANGRWTPLIADTLAQPGKTAELTDGNISALAFGPDGRLWVGYFDRGLDILDLAAINGPRTDHREDDHLFCVNRIVFDSRRKTMAVATANGLVLFDQQNKPRQVMTRRDGLIADHVTDVAFTTDSMVLATPAGLTFVDAAGARSLYAFEGLVNNHVYTLGVEPRTGEILAGTLGGISVLAQEAVERNLTTTNSGLKHNWITAIVPLNGSKSEDTWMVGTYGAGVMQLNANGRFTGMEGATRQMVVNPNAMLSTADHIFAGTLGQGLWTWSRSTGRWKQVTAGLPSENVTALAEHQGEIYVGTENGLVRIAEHLLE